MSAVLSCIPVVCSLYEWTKEEDIKLFRLDIFYLDFLVSLFNKELNEVPQDLGDKHYPNDPTLSDKRTMMTETLNSWLNGLKSSDSTTKEKAKNEIAACILTTLKNARLFLKTKTTALQQMMQL